MTELSHEDLPAYGKMKPIFDVVGREYQMTLAGMLHGKTPTPLQARQVCCWLAEQLKLRLTYVEIAQVLKRSRNCAPMGVAAIEKLRQTDDWLRVLTDRLLAELKGGA
jgi:chromosomal replication initiation ATPase DnaA